MEAVHIIAAYDVGCHLADEVAVLRIAGVKNHQSFVGEEVAGVLEIGMVVGQCLCTLGFGAEGVDPRMTFHLAGMALLHHPL